MNWNQITSIDQLSIIKEQSRNKLQLIFKHSTRCSISSMALRRLEREDQLVDVEYHFLDLIAHRNISLQIAEDFKVQHESPQILLIKDGECIYDESHGGIMPHEIEEQAQLLKK